jgi:hypothetical protein
MKPHRIFLAAILLFVFFTQCNKKKYEQNTFNLTVVEDDNGARTLTWDKVAIIDFTKYEVFRSETELPNPKIDSPLNASFKIATLTKSSNTSFKDTSSQFLKQYYYRVQAVLTSRNLISNAVKKNVDNLYNGAFTLYEFNKELGYLYMFEGGTNNTMSILDVNTNTLLKNKIKLSNSINTNKIIIAKDENGKYLLYTKSDVTNNNTIDVYDAHTLSFIKNITLPAKINDFDVYEQNLYASVDYLQDSLLHIYMGINSILILERFPCYGTKFSLSDQKNICMIMDLMDVKPTK